MLVVNKLKEPSYFGKYQKTISTIFFLLFQLALHVPLWAVIITILTLNVNLVFILLTLTLIQLPIRRSQRWINFLNDKLQLLKYFKSFEIIYQQTIQAQNKCLFGTHPHSIFGLSLLSLVNSSKEGPLSNIVGLSSRFILNFPIAGALLKLWGFQAVNHTNLKKLMRQGKNIGIIPGGYEQATVTCPSQMRIWIQNRKGFIKYALQHQYTLYPVIMTNQHKAYSVFKYWKNFRLWLNKIKIPGVLFWNFWTGIFIPPWLNLHIIIGKGIKANPKGQQVTQEMIDQTHQAYKDELLRMYKKYEHLNQNSPIKLY